MPAILSEMVLVRTGESHNESQYVGAGGDLGLWAGRGKFSGSRGGESWSADHLRGVSLRACRQENLGSRRGARAYGLVTAGEGIGGRRDVTPRAESRTGMWARRSFSRELSGAGWMVQGYWGSPERAHEQRTMCVWVAGDGGGTDGPGRNTAGSRRPVGRVGPRVGMMGHVGGAVEGWADVRAGRAGRAGVPCVRWGWSGGRSEGAGLRGERAARERGTMGCLAGS